jgi:mannosyltransferase
VIFLPSRITPTKGQADLVRAAGILKRRGLECRIVLAGRIDNAAFLSELKELIERQALKNSVEFAGLLGPAELRNWYARSTIVGFPTRHHEGLGRILLECQSMAVPPVVYNIGGTSEGVRDGETGFLVRLGDLEGFVERLAELLTNDTRRRKMAQAGREFVLNQFTLEALALRHEEFYSRFLPSRRRCGAASAGEAPCV